MPKLRVYLAERLEKSFTSASFSRSAASSSRHRSVAAAHCCCSAFSCGSRTSKPSAAAAAPRPPRKVEARVDVRPGDVILWRSTLLERPRGTVFRGLVPARAANDVMKWSKYGRLDADFHARKRKGLSVAQESCSDTQRLCRLLASGMYWPGCQSFFYLGSKKRLRISGRACFESKVLKTSTALSSPWDCVC